MAIILMENVDKDYFIGEPGQLRILKGIDLMVDEGEFLAVVGPSGSGKTTLMNILGCLDRPTTGRYELLGWDISTLSDNELSDIRNQKIGFVFQNFNLIPRLDAISNVELPMLYAGLNANERNERARELLGAVDMSDRAGHRPNELSGGQRQRVAIARALANDPPIILADEPTGSLDSKTGRHIMDIFRILHKYGKTIILITHNKTLAKKADRTITLHDGKIVRK
jgi:putative ABC transport system ATP-binding protein